MAKNDETTTTDEPTREELYEEAQKKDIEGRSQMTKEELADALEKAEHEVKPGDPTQLAEWRKNDYEGGRPADDA